MLGQSLPAINEYKSSKLAISGTANPLVTSAQTQALELCADTDCFVSIGPSAVATATTSLYLPAKVPRLYGCNPGDTVSVIGTSGNLYVTEGR